MKCDREITLVWYKFDSFLHTLVLKKMNLKKKFPIEINEPDLYAIYINDTKKREERKKKWRLQETFFTFMYKTTTTTTTTKIPNSFSIKFYHYWYHYIFEFLQYNLPYMLICRMLRMNQKCKNVYLFKTCSIQLTTNKSSWWRSRVGSK